jgi:hypothetical protein
MNLAELQANFPADVAVPDELQQLLGFANRERQWFAGHFQLMKSSYGDAAEFDGDEEHARRFVVFGRETDGSTYAYWLYEDRELATAPIVYMNSEFQDNCVVANNLREFLALLACNADDLGRIAGYSEFFECDSPVPRLGEFRAWLQKEFEITPPADPIAVIRNAQSTHPNFDAFLHRWQEEYYRDK